MVNNKNVTYLAAKKIPFCISALLMKIWLNVKKNVIRERQFFAFLFLKFVCKSRFKYGKN